MPGLLKTVLLLALPASGKSEVRRYIDLVDPAKRTKDLRMGVTAQLDDYPYVHMMRRIDDELESISKPRHYFASSDRSFIDGKHWGTLIELLNEDHRDLVAKNRTIPATPGKWMLDRMDAAAKKAGATLLASRDAATLSMLANAIEKDAHEHAVEKAKGIPDSLEGKTLVIEFARGGPDNSTFPLKEPVGYRYSISKLSPEILKDAAVLYIWVEPEESKRKNRARTQPGSDGSILHHGVPEFVMREDYGCDDIGWMLETSGKPGAIVIEAHGRKFEIPCCRFDNRVDKTSFLREDEKKWNPKDVEAVHEGLRKAIAALA